MSWPYRSLIVLPIILCFASKAIDPIISKELVHNRTLENTFDNQFCQGHLVISISLVTQSFNLVTNCLQNWLDISSTWLLKQVLHLISTVVIPVRINPCHRLLSLNHYAQSHPYECPSTFSIVFYCLTTTNLWYHRLSISIINQSSSFHLLQLILLQFNFFNNVQSFPNYCPSYVTHSLTFIIIHSFQLPYCSFTHKHQTSHWNHNHPNSKSTIWITNHHSFSYSTNPWITFTDHSVLTSILSCIIELHPTSLQHPMIIRWCFFILCIVRLSNHSSTLSLQLQPQQISANLPSFPSAH